MSTRSVIARPIEGPDGLPGWEGRYMHWDGYPTSKVPDLFSIVEKRGGAEAALRYLIDDHPGGWSSTTGAGEAGGYVEYGRERTEEQERALKELDQCYCHGDRHEGYLDKTRTQLELSVDGTRRGNIMLSHVELRHDPFPDAPRYRHEDGYRERPPYSEWPLTLDDEGKTQYESSDWGQEWLYIIDPATDLLLVFKWGSVGWFGMSAGSEVTPVASYELGGDCPDQDALSRMQDRAYAEA